MGPGMQGQGVQISQPGAESGQAATLGFPGQVNFGVGGGGSSERSGVMPSSIAQSLGSIPGMPAVASSSSSSNPMYDTGTHRTTFGGGVGDTHIAPAIQGEAGSMHTGQYPETGNLAVSQQSQAVPPSGLHVAGASARPSPNLEAAR